MAYQMYTTRALVLSVRDRIGADRMVRMYTEEAGMIDARAAGVREERSKMRYALQPFSSVRVTFVRGRREWRITGVEPERNFFLETTERACRAGLVSLAKLLERFVRGEEESRPLYNLVNDAAHFLSEETHEDALRVLSLRMLHILGYVDAPAALVPLITAPNLATALSVCAADARASIDKQLGHVDTVSHL